MYFTFQAGDATLLGDEMVRQTLEADEDEEDDDDDEAVMSYLGIDPRHSR